jgi:hypothetical protein
MSALPRRYSAPILAIASILVFATEAVALEESTPIAPPATPNDAAPRAAEKPSDEKPAAGKPAVTPADQPSTAHDHSDAKGEPAKTDAVKTREGGEWKGQRGRFTLIGDRVSFTPSDRQINVMVLENLNLERIVRTIEESRTVSDADQLEWTIDGVLTEYRGSNFLLLHRSVLVAKPKKSDSVR